MCSLPLSVFYLGFYGKFLSLFVIDSEEQTLFSKATIGTK